MHGLLWTVQAYVLEKRRHSYPHSDSDVLKEVQNARIKIWRPWTIENSYVFMLCAQRIGDGVWKAVYP